MDVIEVAPELGFDESVWLSEADEDVAVGVDVAEDSDTVDEVGSKAMEGRGVGGGEMTKASVGQVREILVAVSRSNTLCSV